MLFSILRILPIIIFFLFTKSDCLSLAIARIDAKPQVEICNNVYCRAKGSDATMATFSFLAPSNVSVVSAGCLGKCNEGPNCKIRRSDGSVVDASMVSSVESVVAILQKHLNVAVNMTSAEALSLNYEGNIHLKNGDLDDAINCYSKALELGDQEQEGVILVMRGTAMLERAYMSKMRYKELLSFAQQVIPPMDMLQYYVDAFKPLDALVRYAFTYNAINRLTMVFKSLEYSSKWNEIKSKWPEAREGPVVTTGSELLSKVIFAWSLYDYALMSALQDLFKATTVMPGFAQGWRRAGDALGELKQFNSAIEYYEVAARLDPSLADIVRPSIEKLKVLKRLIDNAAERGLSVNEMIALIDD